MKCKCKVKAVRNSRTTLEYTEDTEPGYLWTDFYYVTKKNLPQVSDEDLTHPTQSNTANIYQGVKGGGGYPRNNVSEKIHWLLSGKSWKVMTQEQIQICMDLAEATRVQRSSYDIYRLHKSNRKGGHFIGIFQKGVTNQSIKSQTNHIVNMTHEQGDNDTFKYPKEQYEDQSEESNLKYFKEDNYSDKPKIWRSNIGNINCKVTMYVYLRSSK